MNGLMQGVRGNWVTHKGFAWLVEEQKLPLSLEAVRLKSKAEAWTRHDPIKKPSLEKARKAPPKFTSMVDIITDEQEEDARTNRRPTLYKPEFNEQAEAFFNGRNSTY